MKWDATLRCLKLFNKYVSRCITFKLFNMDVWPASPPQVSRRFSPGPPGASRLQPPTGKESLRRAGGSVLSRLGPGQSFEGRKKFGKSWKEKNQHPHSSLFWREINNIKQQKRYRITVFISTYCLPWAVHSIYETVNDNPYCFYSVCQF